MKTGREIVDAYLSKNPSATDEIRKAMFAYHIPHFREHPKAHHFAGVQREACCRWCGRSRELVRWDGFAPECEARPGWVDASIESVIGREEKKFEKVLARAKVIAADIKVQTITGEDLARLHHTHGLDPTMLECALMESGRGSLPQKLHDDYQVAYDEHCAKGIRGLKREIISGKILEPV